MAESIDVKVGRMQERMDGLQRDVAEFKSNQEKANDTILARINDLAVRLDNYSMDNRDSISNNALNASKVYATKADMVRNSTLTGVIASVLSALVTYILSTHK